ncbi:Hypothetical protein TPAR_09349 [Tolypocladium paradoxum]|uniref:Uncharacterized protein n=1 Tax=Tolypocladium paradoxum TaxID=94208 RepID=A0A2S4L8B0_9HYPO|nr:Hypothetical protein TPAR_09349 [Tolypocladium paradoxum]
MWLIELRQEATLTAQPRVFVSTVAAIRTAGILSTVILPQYRGPCPTPPSSPYQGANPPVTSNPPEYCVDNPDPLSGATIPVSASGSSGISSSASSNWKNGYPPPVPVYSAASPPSWWQNALVPLVALKMMKMPEAMMCAGCGILPSAAIFHYENCNKNGRSFCDRCYNPSRSCKHGLTRVKLGVDEKLAAVANVSGR